MFSPVPTPATTSSKLNAIPSRILIVDDEQAQMKALCDTLSDQGYSTTGFASANAALASLAHHKYDLILTDLMMPEMDGISLLRSALEKDPDLVGIIMTGEGTIATAVEAMKVGAFDYILKPFKLSVVLPVLSRALAIKRLRAENTALEKRVREHTLALEAANKELEAFSYSVSHDLRSPLRHIGFFAETLSTKFSTQIPDEAGDLVTRIRASANRMSQLIEDLLRLSRLGRQHLSKRPTNIAQIVREALDELRKDQNNQAGETRVADLPDCFGDRPLLKQVFVNLLSNAFKFTRRTVNPVIEVGFVQHPGDVEYFVRDNGAGFDMNHAGKLFGVFQRLHSQDEFQGTGVGLSIVQRIIERHNGRVWAEGEVGKGAVFHFTLPTASN